MVGFENTPKLQNVLQGFDAIDINLANQHRDSSEYFHSLFLLTLISRGSPAANDSMHGSGENQKQVFTGSRTSLEVSQTTLDFHFPTTPTTAVAALPKRNRKTKAARAS